jgi:hypothetical protein
VDKSLCGSGCHAAKELSLIADVQHPQQRATLTLFDSMAKPH